MKLFRLLYAPLVPALIPIGVVPFRSLLASYMRPLCLCHHSHRLPVDPKELDRVWDLIESWTLIRKELQQLRSPDELGRPSADILFWNRKLPGRRPYKS